MTDLEEAVSGGKERLMSTGAPSLPPASTSAVVGPSQGPACTSLGALVPEVQIPDGVLVG